MHTGYVPNSDHSTAESKAPGNWQTERSGGERAVQREEHTDSVSPGIWWCVPTVLRICHMTDHVCTANCSCPGKAYRGTEEEGCRVNVKD